MAEKRKTQPTRRPRQEQKRKPRTREKKEKAPRKPLLTLPKRKAPDFKPDSHRRDWTHIFHITQGQWDTFFKWGGYILVILVLHVIQDVIMSRFHLFGATTDLVACCILLITVIEGTENGSVFAILASIVYYFTGSSPGPYTVALITFLGIGACLFRQLFWHRSGGSIWLCASLALIGFEVGSWLTGIWDGLTRWDRFDVFLLTGIYSCIVMIPLYHLIKAIGQIGGNTWKE